jgi:hypothetical protein
VTPAETVIDPGPIAYARIDLCGDPDLEHALREEGLDPQATTYRLIEVPLSSISDTASMPWPRMGTAYVDAPGLARSSRRSLSSGTGEAGRFSTESTGRTPTGYSGRPASEPTTS